MKKIRWVKIAESEKEIDFNEEQLAEVEADGKKLCLGRFGGELFAFSRQCPHAAAALVFGYIDAKGNIVCPLHRYKFCLKNGRNVSGEGYFLKHWPVECRPDGVFVGLESNPLFGLF